MIDDSTVRLIESASEETARFDALLELAPSAAGLAQRLRVIARCALPGVDAQATQAAQRSLAAAAADALHAAALPAELASWQQRIDDEERRARAGHALATARLLGSQSLPDGLVRLLDDALRTPQPPRAVYVRACDAWLALNAASENHNADLRGEAELAATLILCAAGQLDRLRLLPFAGLAADARTELLEAWRSGAVESAQARLLSEAAAQARGERLALRRLIAGLADDEDRLAPLGRAAITARRALGVLRSTLATTMPALSEWLACSRPAAGDALERLVETGLAVELTGRARDRVYADARSWALIDA